jgi:hypothetical protein
VAATVSRVRVVSVVAAGVLAAACRRTVASRRSRSFVFFIDAL